MFQTKRLTAGLLAAGVTAVVAFGGRCSGDPGQPKPPARENRSTEPPGLHLPGDPPWTVDDLRWDPAISGKVKEIEQLKQRIEQLRKVVLPKVFEKQNKPNLDRIAALQKEVEDYVRSVNEAASGRGDSGELLTAERFAQLGKLIRPLPGESRWEEIPWLLSVYDARKKAAAEGKPIFVWSAGGGPPLGGC
jgi:hypothetical protein